MTFMTENLFWYKTCPFCNQGRLFIFKNLSTNRLYLHCEECERGYNDARNINSDSSFLTLEEDFEAVEATFEDIRQFKWHDLQINTVYK